MTPVTIREVMVRHLRCHTALRWQCQQGVNLLLGDNGEGKTTLLEAVYLMARGRSFRQARDPYLVQDGESFFEIQGQWTRFGPMSLSARGKRGQLQITLQGREVQQRKELAMSFPVVVDAPQSVHLVDGMPNERRRWLNALMALRHPPAARVYQQYIRSIMQRSRLLKQGCRDAQLDGWENNVVEYGLQVAALRSQLVGEINDLLQQDPLLEDAMQIRLAHGEYERQAWLERLRNKRQHDTRMGGLRYGPHAERIAIMFRGREIRLSGSRGQQKLAAIALKMAECGLWVRYRGLMPVLLLDDALEALDESRQQRLMQRLLQHRGQVLMTSPAMIQTASSEINIRHIRELYREMPDNEGMNIMEEAA